MSCEILPTPNPFLPIGHSMGGSASCQTV